MPQRWWLDDAEARSREAPDSFFIPPRERRTALAPGRAVKLVFLFEPPAGDGTNGERMWVEVVSARDGTYRGTLLNEPSVIDGLRAGDEIRFEAHHVAALSHTEDELGYRVNDYALVSPRVAPPGSPRPDAVLRVPSDEREDESDSGWRLVTGGDDANEPKWLDLGWLTDRYPELEPVFQTDADAGRWAWSPSEEAYIAA